MSQEEKLNELMQGERQSDERERSKNEIRAQNLRKAFSTPSTRMAFIALGVVFLIIVASFFRGGEKKQAVETAKIEEVKTPRIDDRSMPRVSEQEAENRKIQAQKEADQAASSSNSFQPQFDLPAEKEPDTTVDLPPAPKLQNTPPPVVAQKEDKANNDAQRRAEEERARRLADAEAKRERYRQALADQALAQIEKIGKSTGAASTPNITMAYLPPDYEKLMEEKEIERVATANAGLKSTGKNVLIKTGNTLYATLDSEVNTDDGGVVLATVRGGEWAGSKLIGRVEQAPQNIRIVFSTLAPQDGRPTLSINALALRDTDLKQGVAETIETHLLSRYAALAASSLLGGAGKAFQGGVGTTVVTGSSTVTTRSEPSSSEIIGNAVGGLGDAFSGEVKSGFNRPTTYATPANKGFVLYFLQDVEGDGKGTQP